nr:hypothetical protein GCM10020093_073800 [Planobispora longispora]
MPQFAMIIFAPTPGDWESAPADEMEALEAYAAKVDEIGVKTVTGYALHPSTQGKSVSRDGGVKDGAFVDAPTSSAASPSWRRTTSTTPWRWPSRTRPPGAVVWRSGPSWASEAAACATVTRSRRPPVVDAIWLRRDGVLSVFRITRTTRSPAPRPRPAPPYAPAAAC